MKGGITPPAKFFLNIFEKKHKNSVKIKRNIKNFKTEKSESLKTDSRSFTGIPRCAKAPPNRFAEIHRISKGSNGAPLTVFLKLEGKPLRVCFESF